MEHKNSISEFTDAVKRFMKINKKDMPLFVLAISLIIFSTVLQVINNMLMGTITDAVATGHVRGIYKGVWVILALQCVRFPLSYFAQYQVNDLSERCTKTIRKHTYSYISRGSMEWLDASKTGDILTRVNNDLGTMVGALNRFMTWELSSFIALFTALVGCFMINWKLSLISFTAIPVIAVIQANIAKPIGRWVKRRQEAEGEAVAVFVDLLNGLSISKAFNLEQYMHQKFKSYLDISVKYGVKSFSLEFLMLPLQIFMNILPHILIIMAGSYYVVRGEMTLGNLLAFTFLSNMVLWPIDTLAWQIRDIYHTSGIAGRIFEIWDMPIEEDGGNEITMASQLPVVFQNVSFSYNSVTNYDYKESLLKEINLEIKEGESVALVGPSGSGKSTLLKMIAGFYHKRDGDLMLWGHSIEAWQTKALRKHISYVGQEAYLFPGSIYDNVALGNLEAGVGEVLEVINEVGLNNLNIYDSIGERGIKLSGGQRQRVCIARALLKNAPLILLDEPTSALDTESEYQVNLALEKLVKKKTCVTIGHRLSAIRNVDRIICLDSGVIVQQGSHDELIGQKGLYKRLYESQTKEVMQHA